MANFFIKRPIFAIVVALVITIAGALCIFSLPIDRYPKITPPQVSVHATYPGADSEVVAQTVAEVIEKNVVGAEGFDNMSSTSNSNGSYSLSVQFLTGTDSDMATIRVQNGVTAADAGHGSWRRRTAAGPMPGFLIRSAPSGSPRRNLRGIWHSSSVCFRRMALTMTYS